MKIAASSILCSLVVSSFVMGCGSDAATTASASASAPAKSAAPMAAKSSAPAASATATATAMTTASAAASADAPKVELVEKDLSKAGAAFKGWSAKGPADAEVMEDMSGARIATKKVAGPGSFDLAWKLAKLNAKDLKTNLQKGADASKAKLTFTSDTPDDLEWTTEIGTSKSYSFSIGSKVAGKDVTCYTVTSRETAADVAALKDACKSLAKK